jgi:hypothetical protein
MRGFTCRDERLGAALRAAGAITLLLVPVAARGEEWHEAYHAGVQALARGNAEAAVAALTRAVALRPEPGRNVLTYGTNVVPRYFPYLRLAEACLALGRLEQAQEALAASAGWQREPADERQKLEARLRAAVAERHPPATTVPPAPPSPTPAAEPVATPVPTATPALVTPSPPPAPSPEIAVVLPSPRATPPPPRERSVRETPAPSPKAVPPTLEVLSEPSGALVYVDDVLLGSTDPQTARLVTTGLGAGRHRVRVSLEGYQDAVREIDVSPGQTATFYASLTRASAARLADKKVVQFGVAALALAAVAGWLTLRRSGSALSSIWTRTPLTRSRRSRPSAPSPAGPLSPGAVRDDLGRQWFGDFQLLELLGRGGMASVYRADRGGELVALKRPLTAFLENPDFVKRFEREADIGRTLNHPNIVRILERGDVEGVPYFTMELVVGQTLQGLLKTRGALEPQAAAGVVAQAAEALDLAHGKGVIHRDLKPSNIMLLPDGTAKVMDFGIASARRFEGLTATGDFLGTPDYVAPEVIEGSDAEPRSDLYSLGIVFYELLTGRRPFTGDTPFAILKKHCTETPPPPSRLRGDVPQDLDAVVVRLLEKEPAARFKDAEELVVTLRDWLNRSA